MNLLLPPGIGDLHWLMLKMGAFSRVMNGGRPVKIYLTRGDPSRDRAADYIRRLPFATFGDFYDIRQHKNDFHAALVHGTIFEKYHEVFDYYFSYNPQVEAGLPIEEWWPAECEPDYFYGLTPNDDEVAAYEEWTKGGPYILASFYRSGWYESWWQHVHPIHAIAALRDALPGYRIILTGAAWDVELVDELARATGAINIAGQTNLNQLFGLIRGCAAFVGHAAGNGIMAVHFRRPTWMLWHPQKFKPAMWTCWAPPGEDHYVPIDVSRYSAKRLAGEVAERLRVV